MFLFLPSNVWDHNQHQLSSYIVENISLYQFKRNKLFSPHIYLFCNVNVSARVQILLAQTRKFILGDDVTLEEIAEFLLDTVTGTKIKLFELLTRSNWLCVVLWRYLLNSI